MSAGRIVGGILALAAGALLLIGIFASMAEWDMEFIDTLVLVNLIIAVLMIVGGILGLVKIKTVGGILALAGGGLLLIGGLLAYFTPFWYLSPLSIFYFLIPSDFTYFFALESIIGVVGGILLLVSGSKE